MSSEIAIDLFVEDRAHEEFVKALVRRIGDEEQCVSNIQVRAARGGAGNVFAELRTYLTLVEKGIAHRPDVLVIAIDGNCTTFARRTSEITDTIGPGFDGLVVTACPDPYVERWFLADPDSFYEVVEHRPVVRGQKCERGYYKQLLAEAIRRGGHPASLGGIDFAVDLVRKMDLYRAGKNDHSLKAFVDGLRTRLRTIGL